MAMRRSQPLVSLQDLREFHHQATLAQIHDAARRRELIDAGQVCGP
jgi:hypothetical protein